MTIHKRQDFLWQLFLATLLLLPLSLFAKGDGAPSVLRSQTNSVTFTTKRAVGQQVKIKIKSSTPVTAQGLKGSIDTEGEYPKDYTLTSQTVTLTGDIVELVCFSNELTELSFSPDHPIASLNCCANHLQGEAMTKLFTTLPDRTALDKGSLIIYDSNDENEANHALKSDVARATAKNWEVLQLGQWWAKEPYIGEDDPVKPVGNETITFTTAKSKGEKLIMSLLASTPVEATGLQGEIDPNGNEVEYILDGNTITLRGTITQLSLKGNFLTSVSLSDDSQVEYLELSNNYLIAPHVEKLISQLPSRVAQKAGELVIFDSTLPKEFNYCSTADVASAQGKGWTVMQHDKDHNIIPYEGKSNKAPKQGEERAFMKTDKLVGQKLGLAVRAFGPVTATGIEGTIIPDGRRREFTITDQEIVLEGSISYLDCSRNELTSLKFDENEDLESVMCDNNRITGDAMKQLIASLPDRAGQKKGEILVFEGNIDDANRCLISDVATAQGKNWQVQQWFAGSIVPYAGYGELPKGGKITIQTSKAVGEAFSMKLVAEGPVTVIGIKEELSIDDHYNDYTLTNSTITIYGAVKVLECYSNRITSLDIEEATKLYSLNCYGNQLKQLDLSKAPHLNTLVCDDNLLVGEEMTKTIQSLPDRTDQEKKAVAVVYDSSQEDANRCLVSDVAIALKKNWQTAQWSDVGGELTAIPYAGYDAVVSDDQIRMTTQLAIGDKIQLSIVALGPVSAEGIEGSLVASGAPQEYTLTSQEVIIKGAVSVLFCFGNKLTALDVSKNKSLITVVCDDNMLIGNQMTSLVQGLPDRSKESKTGNFVVYDSGVAEDGNRCLVSDVDIVAQRGWMPTQWVKGQNGQRSPAMYLGYDMTTGKESVTFATDKVPGEKVTLALDAQNPIVAEGLGEGVRKAKDDQVYTLAARQVVLKGTLKQLKLSGNEVTSLRIDDTNQLERIECQDNKLSEEAIDKLIASLPSRTSLTEGALLLFDATKADANVCSKEQVAKAMQKNWKVLQLVLDAGERKEIPYGGYNGITPAPSNTVQLYPSPATTTLSIEGATPHAQLALYDSAGRLVLQGAADAYGASTIDVASYPRGAYILQIEGVSYSLLLD